MRSILIVLMLIVATVAEASHFIGFTLHAGYTGTADDYRLRYTLYRKCSGAAAPPSYIVRHERNGTFQGNFLMTQVSSSMHTNMLCIIGSPANCASGFGIEMITYETVVSLPATGLYHFIVASEAPAWMEANYAETWLEVQPGLHNNLPEFVSNPEFYFCVNSPVNYPSYAIDLDGDSIVYSITDANSYDNVSQTLSPFFYLPGNSPATFNVSLSPPALMLASGTVNFFPVLVASGIMVVKADEYRNGVWLGSVMRQTGVIITSGGTGVDETGKNYGVSLSPNPANDKLYIKSDFTIRNYAVMDASGRILKEEEINGEDEIDISFLNTGIYFLKMYSDDGEATLRFIKED